MNTEMADGAAQRCVAQIGEALFGQPGLTLMELAEKVKTSRSLLSDADVLEVVARYVGKTSAAYRYIAEDLATRHAANMDDAQPSPAGQGDALVALAENWRACADKHESNALEADSIGGMPGTVRVQETKAEVLRQVATALETALAARQPVYAQGCDELRQRTDGERAAYLEGVEEGKKIAARQPVGQEPVARVKEDGDIVEVGLSLAPGMYLYAAPPAQAVVPDGYVLSLMPKEDTPAFNAACTAAHEESKAGTGPCGVFIAGHRHMRANAPSVTAQAVDLGQFRDLIGFAALAAINLPETDPRRDFIRQANEFAKLIDGKAVKS